MGRLELADLDGAKAAQADLCELLVRYGFEEVRPAKHGRMFRHPILAKEHPDINIRMTYAYVQVPRDSQDHFYPARDVKNAIAAVLAFETERKD
jgi:hypothetical protein